MILQLQVTPKKHSSSHPMPLPQALSILVTIALNCWLKTETKCDESGLCVELQVNDGCASDKDSSRLEFLNEMYDQLPMEIQLNLEMHDTALSNQLNVYLQSCPVESSSVPWYLPMWIARPHLLDGLHSSMLLMESELAEKFCPEEIALPNESYKNKCMQKHMILAFAIHGFIRLEWSCTDDVPDRDTQPLELARSKLEWRDREKASVRS